MQPDDSKVAFSLAEMCLSLRPQKFIPVGDDLHLY